MTFFAVIGIIFCILFLGAFAFGAIISVAAYVEERRKAGQNRREGNLRFTADKPHRFKKN